MSILRHFESHPNWPEVKSVIAKLQEAGFRTLLVGGCVRDALMNRVAKDFDIVTKATPDEVSQIFPRALDVGKAFGVMILPMQGFRLEVATFRKDKEYIDGRRPEGVEFSDAKEDALRRDFTVNALFYDPIQDAVIDYVDGEADLHKGLLKAVGDPQKRMAEDHLRLLRAARFVAQLGFSLEPETEKAVCTLYKNVRLPSKERITEEFEKLSMSMHLNSGFEVLYKTKMLHELFPEMQFYLNPDSWNAFQKGLYRLSSLGRLSLLLSWMAWVEFMSVNCEKPLITKFTYLLLSRERVKEIEFLCQGLNEIRRNEKGAYYRLNESLGPLLTELAFIAADCELFPRDNVQKTLDLFLSRVGDNGALPKPWITGDDLLRLGLQPSARFSTLLKEVYEKQLSRELSSPADAVAWLKKITAPV